LFSCSGRISRGSSAPMLFKPSKSRTNRRDRLNGAAVNQPSDDYDMTSLINDDDLQNDNKVCY
jgi:hypothetical protein